MNPEPTTAPAAPSTIPYVERLEGAIASYLQAVDAGQAAGINPAARQPTPEDWIARYPDVAEGLRAFFADQERMNILAGRTTEPALGPFPHFKDYQILEAIGLGGMGMVYKAHRKSTNSTLALKVIRPDRLEGLAPERRRKIIQRFIIEAQAAAQLEHDHLVKVYEVGEEGGRPFYSMRYVEGSSLNDMLAAGPLDPRRAAGYLEPVARAVHEAHRHGILHRDLKPQNILLAPLAPLGRGDGGEEYRPLVADFGLAKLLQPEPGELGEPREPGASAPGVTHTGEVMGTPAYMSPEQATNSAKVTVASDVYGLGATLYALLTSRPPFEGDTPIDILHKVIHEAPIPLRRLQPSIPLDLETICLKCLEKEPNRRYADAEALARDLQNFLAGKPIEARPVGTIERAWLWCRRKPVVAGLTSAVAASLLVGICASTAFAIRADIARAEEQERAEGEKRAKEDALKAAEQEKRAKQAATAREVETSAVLDYVERRIFGGGGIATAEAQLGFGFRNTLVEGTFGLNRDFKGQPLLEARLRMFIGSSFRDVGQEKMAVDQFQRAYTIYRHHCGPDAPETLKSMSELARGYVSLAQFTDALRLREEALALTKGRFGPNHPETYRRMWDLYPHYILDGRGAEAEKLSAEMPALEDAEGVPDFRSTIDGMDTLARWYFKEGRHADAVKVYEAGLALLRAKLGPAHENTLAAMTRLAHGYTSAGRHDDASKLYEAKLTLLRANAPADWRSLSATMSGLAESYAKMGQHADAFKLREERLALAKGRLGPDDPETLGVMRYLADRYSARGRHADAISLWEEALPLMKAKLGPDSRDTLSTMHSLARAYAAVGRHADVIKVSEEMLPLLKPAFRSGYPHPVFVMERLAHSYTALGRHSETLTVREQLLAHNRAHRGADHRDTLFAMTDLADSLFKLNRAAEAHVLLDECARLDASKKDDKQLLMIRIAELRLRQFEKTRNGSGCRQIAEAWEQPNRTDAVILYNAACYRAVTAAVIKVDPKTAPADAPRLAREEADKAMDWLRKAVAAGFKDVEHMKQDKDLDALREREDFKKLLMELENK
jgi:serine/threonine protein kinase